MSIDKNPQALAQAYKKCKGKLQKIKDLGITPDMDDEAIDALIENLSAAKAVEQGKNISEMIAGQRWYVENLVEFSGLPLEKQFQKEYEDSFADTASETEMLAALRTMLGIEDSGNQEKAA